uniref:Toll-like receptor 21 n=1 Tax=Petromyzon marinus TaxID=7757 RepID=S4RJV8_PETMA
DIHNTPQVLNLSENSISELRPGIFQNDLSIRTLNLSINRIGVLDRDAFRGLSELRYLLLDHNFLKRLSPELFAPLRSILNISLMHNALRNFPSIVQAVANLSSLHSLDLSGNYIQALNMSGGEGPVLPQNLSWLHLANNSISAVLVPADFFTTITFLDLSHNGLKDVGGLESLNISGVSYLLLGDNRLEHSLEMLCSSRLMQKVQSLFLMRNGITNLTAGALRNCTALRHLDLSRNHIRSMQGYSLVGPNHGLRSLMLDYNRLNVLEPCDTCMRLPHLETLSLAWNKITLVQNSAFVHVPSLRSLILKGNLIFSISQNPFRGLRELTELRLDNNLIHEFHVSSPFAALENLQTLNLRRNRIKRLHRQVFGNLTQLKILDLGSNMISSLKEHTFVGLEGLRNLYLDENSIGWVTPPMFTGLESLRILDLVKNMISYSTRLLDNPPFVKLSNLITLKLSAQQPYGIQRIPENLFAGLRLLENLHLAGNQISDHASHPFDDLVSLRLLEMQHMGSGLQTMNRSVFHRLTNLSILDLRNVGLSAVADAQFLTLGHLKTLYLVDNAIGSITEEAITPLGDLNYLDMSGNPVVCTCDNSWFQNWSLHSQVQVVGLYSLSCSSGESDSSAARFADFDMAVCREKEEKILFFTVTPSLALFVALTLVHVKARWHIRYGFHVFLAWFREQRRRAADGLAHDYDAFISYNSRDEAWVMSELVPCLERDGGPLPPYRLCLHHRDFVPGRYIVDNIVDAIYKSRRTVCVVSRGFLRSEWCSMEMQMASYRLFSEHRDVLVTLIVEDIADRELSAHHRMHRLLCTKTHVVWPRDEAARPLFWAKLRTALGEPSAAA